MKNIELYIIIFLLAALVTCEEFMRYYHNEAEKAKSNLAVSKEQWKDKEGRYISEVGQITTNLSNMKNVFKKDSSKISSDYEKHIFYLKRELESLGVKYKNLLNFTTGQVTVRDTFITKLVKRDTTLTGTHTDGYLTQNFSLDRQFNLTTDYTYKDSINVMNIRRPKLKENGKKHFPNWGRLPWVGWDEKILMYSNNPKAKYSGVFSVKTER